MVVEEDRRPIGARSTKWAQLLTTQLTAAGVTPNQVSVMSVIFGALGALLFCTSVNLDRAPSAACLLGAGVCIQARLLCNMLDGMIAVEGGKQSKLGALFNELPDRIADSLFLVTAGYASNAGTLGIQLGWAAALLAMLTAYVRAFGASQGLKQDFCGPMAKPHRMFALTGACVLAACESIAWGSTNVLLLALIVIVGGTTVTVVRRTLNVAKQMEQSGS